MSSSSLMSSIDFIFDTNLTEDYSQEDLLRGRVYLAILEFEKVLYKIMDWKLVFTFVGQDGSVLFAGEWFLRALYKEVGVGRKPTKTPNEILEKTSNKKTGTPTLGTGIPTPTLDALKKRNENTKSYYQATIERFNFIKEMVQHSKAILKSKFGNKKIKSTIVKQSYLYYIKDKKYYFYNNSKDPFQYPFSLITKPQNIITHIEYLKTIKEFEEYNNKTLPKKINRGNISEGYTRFLITEEGDFSSDDKEQQIQKIMSYMRNDNVSQLFGGDVQKEIQTQANHHYLQFSVKSYDYSLASYKSFIVFAKRIVTQGIKIKLSEFKDTITKGHDGKINLTNAIEKMVRTNIESNLLPNSSKKINNTKKI